MCTPALLAPAAKIGSTLQAVGTIASIGGTLAQASAEARSERRNANLATRQARTEAALSAIEDVRTRERFRAALAQQTAELAARGISLDSPTAILLAEDAGREMAFASREVRTRGVARGQELRAEARVRQARARSAYFGGVTSAAGKFLDAAPDIWPGLGSSGVLR